MNGNRRFRAWTLTALAILALASPVTAAVAAEKAPAEDQELTIGKATFEELKAKGEIIESSPLYDVLMPVIQPILRAAQPRYNHPFKVYLVHEAHPNAFATPGGYIYVVDELLYFAKNKEQLAGTLGHEVAHAIHHDSMELLKKDQAIRRREIGGAILLGPTRARVLAIALLGKLHALSYSREAESRADLTGSDLCAEAGVNPWGLVWLFQEFKDSRQREIPQFLSDHPSDRNRMSALERHFRKNPGTFSRFDSNPHSATALSVPAKAPVVFLR